MKKNVAKRKNFLLPTLLYVFLILAAVGIFIYLRNRNIMPVSGVNNHPGQIISGKFDQSKFKTDDQWRQLLTPMQYHIMRQAGTEIPFTGPLDYETRPGVYYSAGCDTPLFSSKQKYDSGTGWPSFWAPISPAALVLRRESDPSDDRIEVLDVCGNHLGHVFDDGPPPTGKRYCMNSAALRFVPDK